MATFSAHRRFAEAVFGVYQEGDVVWVQDYHLMLLPALLKKQKPKMKVRCCASAPAQHHVELAVLRNACLAGLHFLRREDAAMHGRPHA